MSFNMQQEADEDGGYGGFDDYGQYEAYEQAEYQYYSKMYDMVADFMEQGFGSMMMFFNYSNSQDQ